MLYFFHGLESGPHGQKYHLLKAQYPEVTSPDFQGMDLNQRIAHAERITRDQHGLTVVGSSFGGLLAARLYSLYPERFKALVLLAPAVHTEEGDRVEQLPPASHIRVLHGLADDVVPHAKVDAFCQRFGLEIISVDDEHRLAAESSQQAILDLLAQVYERS
ncbi:alpha/beta hydrolase [Aliidiomarina halalkaliphila]|uniref:Alpha/beta hydrolase n=1 Tax=Aliidiomarina halalkaliphila TaxID=2593535 RepID=A0A552X5U1_9GAMM|nr:alpha/beta fold hydrolase [Aliidiomarina halalkaliphila]TRW50372.1 alpha/beta hydrolase [Aliidiomarina halalkaliphila]